MCLAVFETFGILCLLKMLDVFESLFSTWSHHHLYLRLGRVYGVHVGCRGFGGGGRIDGHHDEDVEAGQGEDVVWDGGRAVGLPEEDVEAPCGYFVTDRGPEYMDSL